MSDAVTLTDIEFRRLARNGAAFFLHGVQCENADSFFNQVEALGHDLGRCVVTYLGESVFCTDLRTQTSTQLPARIVL